MSDKGIQTAMYKITKFKVPKARLVTEGIDLANEIEFKTEKKRFVATFIEICEPEHADENFNP